MQINFLIVISGNLPRADNGNEQNRRDYEIDPSTVTLSRSEGCMTFRHRDCKRCRLIETVEMRQEDEQNDEDQKDPVLGVQWS